MRYAGTERDDDTWGRLGSLDVTTTVAIVLAWTVMLIVFVVEPVSKPVNSALFLDTSAVTDGQLWRLITWPLAMPAFSLWTIVTAAMFWLFGSELERQTGRIDFLRLFVSIVGIYTAFYVVLATLLKTDEFAAGLAMPTFAVVLLYIAEHPRRPFFFDIPAWVIGAAIVALEILNDLAYRQWVQLLTVLLASAVIAVIARRVGLLSMYDQIPELPRRGRTPATSPGKNGSVGRSRRSRLAGRFGRREAAEIVAMPTPAPVRSQPMPQVSDNAAADDLALDALLDKISAGGMAALSDDERRQLDEIRARRHRDS
ncbi:MAG: rhomboid family intramembrane serine protease [Patulibacter sp.]